MSRRNFISLSIAGIVCGIFIACIHNPSSEMIRTLEEAFLYARDGYVKLADRAYSNDAFYCLLNIVLFLPFISQIFFSDYETAKSFVFVRLDNVSRWYNHKVFQSEIYSLYASCIYNLALLATVFIMGFRANSVWIVSEYFVLGTLAGFLILFMIANANHVLSLVLKPHLSISLIIGLTVATMVITCILNDGLIQFSVLTNYFISWHMVLNENSVFYYYPTWTYYASILLIIAAEYFIGKRIMKKADLI